MLACRHTIARVELVLCRISFLWLESLGEEEYPSILVGRHPIGLIDDRQALVKNATSFREWFEVFLQVMKSSTTNSR